VTLRVVPPGPRVFGRPVADPTGPGGAVVADRAQPRGVVPSRVAPADPSRPCRDLTPCAPGLVRRWTAFAADMAAHGEPVAVEETTRTDARQAWLYAQGRTRAGAIVTDEPTAAHTGHGYGIALDFRFLYDPWGFTPARRALVLACAQRADLFSGVQWAPRFDAAYGDLPHLQCHIPGVGTAPTQAMRVARAQALASGVWAPVWALVPAALA